MPRTLSGIVLWRVTAAWVFVFCWMGSPLAFAQPRVATAQLDFTRNGVINAADAWRVVDAWNALQRTGQCLAPDYVSRDVDANGCIDVADVQTVLAHWSEPISPVVAAHQSAVNTSALADAETVVVNTTTDGDDLNPGDGVCKTALGRCSLKAAIEETNVHPGRDTINFNIRNPDGTCLTRAAVLSPVTDMTTTLTLDDSAMAGTVINGFSQCGATRNTLAAGGNANLRIALKGTYDKLGDYGLVLDSPFNDVRGMAIYGWDADILITNSQAISNVVAGDFLGTNPANTYSQQFRGTLHGNGLNIRYYASGNQIGGSDPGDRNIISGNGSDGMASDETGLHSIIINNYIGLKQDGVTQLTNGSDGIDFNFGASYNIIGGPDPRDRNVISGNSDDGIELSHIGPGKITEYNKVIGNYIGLSAFGGQIKDALGNPLLVGNHSTGLTLEDHQHAVEAYGNYFANNGDDGVRLYSHATVCYIHDNIIGLAPDGTRFPNGMNADPAENYHGDGIWIYDDSQQNVIARNTITASKANGITISNYDETMYPGTASTDFNTITQNAIYDNAGIGIGFEALLGDFPNQGIKAPVITAANTRGAVGTACANCTIELFVADQTSLAPPNGETAGEGKTYIGSATSDATGIFSATFAQAINPGVLLTGTATDSLGNTSRFSENVQVVDAPLVPPTPAPTDAPTAVPPPTATPGAPHVSPTQRATPPVSPVSRYEVLLPIVLQ